MFGPTRGLERNRVRRVLMTLLLLLPASAAVRAQQAEPNATPRPRIALVLSGGGARGIAHIGVLRALERLHIPIDSITGTSMGAVVGGLYASGYSPDELETIIGSLDWRELFRDTPDRRHLPYRRKVDDHTYLTRWEVGFTGRAVRIPSALVAGQRLGSHLRILALRAAGIRDFDKLPIPFNAIATDVTTGEMITLDRGDLATAIRASMAVPGLFSPVDVDGRLLVDGGLVANLPVDVARRSSPDVVIAVDVGKSAATRKRPDSVAAILSQTMDFVVGREVERALAKVDVLVRPEVADMQFMDFHAAETLIARGDAAAAGQADALRKLSLDDAAWSAWLLRQRRATPKLELRSVTIDPGLDMPPQAARRAVRTRPGELDPLLLRDDLERMWELGEFELVDFTLDREPAGTWALTINGRRKSWGPNFLRAGLALMSDMEGTSRFNLLGAMTMTQLNRRGGELKVTAQVGGDPSAAVEWYQPLTGSRVPFLAIGFGGMPSKAQVAVGNESVQYRYWSQRTNFDLGLSLGRYGEWRAGVRHDLSHGGPTHEAAGAPRYHSTDVGVWSGIVFDQLDRINFPRQGTLAAFEIYQARPSMGADLDYRRLDFSMLSAATLRRHTIVGFLHGTSALGGVLPSDEQLRLGGLLNLSGLPPGEISGNYGGVFAALYLCRIGRLPYFGDGIYLGASAETGNAWVRSADVSTSDLHHSFALIFGADTVVGPLYIAHGVTPGEKDSFYLYLGRSF